MKFIVGLTGGIGSGKSAVAALFINQGITVVDADIAARKVVEPGSPALAAIAEHFGEDLLQADGCLDRAALRAIVFDNENERLWLEQLLHPAIGQWISGQLANAQSPYAILESPLLLETSQHEMADRIIVVDVPQQLQIDRACSRDGNSPDQIKAIIAAQMSREARLEKADDVIDNSGELETLAGPVRALHQQYLELAREKSSCDQSSHEKSSRDKSPRDK